MIATLGSNSGICWVVLLGMLAIPGWARQADPVVEARGLWVTRWDYLSAWDIRDLVQKAASAGFNQIYFQVRAAADAYYRSSLEPWAARLSGKLGKDPGWDPLACAITEAHSRGIELHAWVNLATGWTGMRMPPRSQPQHILRKHPHWRVVSRLNEPVSKTNGYVFVSLVNPDLQEHLLAVIKEIVGQYEVDGLHLDYARYPASHTSYDRVSNRLYREAKKKNPSIDRSKWQSLCLAEFIQNISRQAKRLRPEIEVSAAVCGIYKNRWGWTGVVEGSVDFHQDSHLWAQMGAVDALIPMLYWKPTQPPGKKADFYTLADDFRSLSGQVKLLAGINVEAGDYSVLEQEITISRQLGYRGVVLFAYQGLEQSRWFERLPSGVFDTPALPRNWLEERLHWDRIKHQVDALRQKWLNPGQSELMLWGVFDGLFHPNETPLD